MADLTGWLIPESSPPPSLLPLLCSRFLYCRGWKSKTLLCSASPSSVWPRTLLADEMLMAFSPAGGAGQKGLAFLAGRADEVTSAPPSLLGLPAAVMLAEQEGPYDCGDKH